MPFIVASTCEIGKSQQAWRFGYFFQGEEQGQDWKQELIIFFQAHAYYSANVIK